MKGTPEFICIRGLYGALSMLPSPICIRAFEFAYRIFLRWIPKYKYALNRNLELVYPDSDAAWRRKLYLAHTREMGRLFADTVRLPRIDEKWVRQHVSIPNLEEYAARLNNSENKGVLIATGHFGSFELLGHSIGLMGYPLSAVARNFKSPQLDNWWRTLREARGNRIIGRRGAFKEIVATLQSGRSVAVLFDQNVRREHGLFVDWFGIPAATVKSIALAALRTEVPVFVAGIRYVGDDRYVCDSVDCKFEELYRNTSLSREQKIKIITQTISDHFCEMIRAHPEGWFWAHRWWRTRPPHSPENLY